MDNTAEGAGTSFVPATHVSVAGEPASGWYTVHEAVTVTFVTDKGDAPEAQKIAKGATATEPTAPVVAGFVFEGWFAPEAADAFDFATAINDDLTLTAQWSGAATTVITIVDNGDGTSTTNVVGSYATIAEAVQQAPAGAMIVLNDDIALADTVRIDKDLVIDLNGNDIAATNVRAIWIKAGNVELAGEGTISATGSGLDATSSVICVGDGDSNANTAGLTIGEGVTVSSDKCCGVLMCGENAGTLTISGGSVTGPTAVYVTSGTVNVTGGTLTGTGDALVIDSCNYPDSVPSASITGGTFLSTSGKPVATYATDRQARVTGIIPGMVNDELNPARFSSANVDGVAVPVDARISLDVDKKIGSMEVDLDGEEYATKAFLVGLSVSDAPEGD